MEGSRYCTVCEIRFQNEEAIDDHAQTPNHRLRYLQNFYTVNRSAFLKEKQGVIITALDSACSKPAAIKEEDGTITMYLKNECEGESVVYIKNNNRKGAVMLREVMCLYPCEFIILSDKHDITQGATTIKLKYGAKYQIRFTGKGGKNTVESMLVVFQFSLDDNEEIFNILRILTVQFVDDISASILPNSLFEKIPNKTMLRPPRPGSYIPGRAAPGYDKKIPPTVFTHYYPDFVRDLALIKFDPKRINSPELRKQYREIRRLLNHGLQPYNYADWFEMQLWLEEIQREIDIRVCNQTSVSLSRLDDPDYGDSIELLVLSVPGLLEKRPNVMQGDSVFVTYTGHVNPKFQGCVHRIVDEMVHIGMDETFMREFREESKMDVQFTFNRLSFIRSHTALKHIDNPAMMNILFPSEPKTPSPTPEYELEFYDQRISNNPEQRQAVTAMVNEVSAPAPYVLFGPPGTGKTLTIVEAIKQVYKKDRQCNMLVCGPSNSCCDLLTERLLTDIPREHIIRIHAKTRLVRGISGMVRSVSAIEDNQIMNPNLEKIGTYRIVVTTFMSAAIVVPVFPINAGKLESGFTHIFLDECGHGQEPEALIPLLGLGRMVVLTGDPRQLGPVVHSKICMTDGSFFKGYGLDQSLLERLMKTDLYSPDEIGNYNPRLVTKLLNNFRSHSDILEIPNKLFYQSQLRPCADGRIVNSLLRWSQLPNKEVPLIFHGVNGKDDREGNNPSFFNPHEVSRVIKYVKQLRNKMQVKPENIGIVAPYRAQIKKIRTALMAEFNGWAIRLRVGSPEEFQGDERLVIIVSTVRASAEYLLNDLLMQLGFLRNPKRFNVAVTRAQALLIIVGSPWLMHRDQNWGALLEYCHSKGCYIGCPYKALDNAKVDHVYGILKSLDIDVSATEEDSDNGFRARRILDEY